MPKFLRWKDPVCVPSFPAFPYESFAMLGCRWPLSEFYWGESGVRVFHDSMSQTVYAFCGDSILWSRVSESLFFGLEKLAVVFFSVLFPSNSEPLSARRLLRFP